MTFQIPPGNPVASDTETTGLYWRHGDRPYCFSFANVKFQTEVLSFPVNPKTRQVEYDDRLDLIRDVYQDPTIAKIFHNAAFDKGMIESVGIKVRGEIIDTMNLIRLVIPGAPIKLKPFCMQYLGIPDDDEKDLKEATRHARVRGEKLGWKVFHSASSRKQDGSEIAADYWMAGKKFYEKYCVQDSVRAMSICRALWDGIKELGIEKLWINEQETFDVLRRIEHRGIRIFRKKVLGSKEELKKKLHFYEERAISRVEFPLTVERSNAKEKLITKASELNLNSSQQLSAILYGKYKEPVKYLTEKAKNPSTDSAALQAMTCPVAKDILNMRACEKTIQFMDQYLHFMVQHKDNNWYIHPNLHQALAVTGRESCSDPNLQQVASGERETKLDVRVEARSVFGPRPHYYLRSYDWKNIEVYIPGFKSKDRKITKMLRAGEDVHEHTSRELTRRIRIPIGRFEAKRTFFGLQYGIGPNKLSKTLGISSDLAGRIILEIKHEYPELFEFLDDLILQARKYNHIKTAYGRKIFIDSKDSYKAPNYYVQGTAGGILKFAKVKVDRALRKKDAYMVLPIHDELLIEIGHSTSIDEIDRTVVACMQDNPELSMPVNIPVSISRIGSNWSKKEKVRVA